VADQPDHLARRYVQRQAAQHRAVAVAEIDVAHLDAPFHLRQLHRVRRFGNARDVIEDLEDAFRAGRGLLRVRDDPAHRIEPRIEPADVREKRREHTDRDPPA